MLIKHSNTRQVKSSEITSKSIFLNRREVVRASLIIGSILPVSMMPRVGLSKKNKLVGINKSKWSQGNLGEPLTSYDSITSYNNFYEFGTGKTDPSKNAHTLKTKPWSIVVDGLCRKPGTYNIEDVIKNNELEERVYRFRCVEAWSMVIPWIGIEFSNLIKKFEPTQRARYVAFETLFDPNQMPGQRSRVLKWPYREGLRMDEAMNPLTLIATGLYGEELPNQNGAPLRLVVPWKYGFKSIKSIVRISFLENLPLTSWNMSAPLEYGFYSNVNPNVSHPRWGQSHERRIGNFFKQPTLMFNGYEKEVGHLYKDMDLKKYF